jgi:hypothetical protein
VSQARNSIGASEKTLVLKNAIPTLFGCTTVALLREAQVPSAQRPQYATSDKLEKNQNQERVRVRIAWPRRFNSMHQGSYSNSDIGSVAYGSRRAIGVFHHCNL